MGRHQVGSSGALPPHLSIGYLRNERCLSETHRQSGAVAGVVVEPTARAPCSSPKMAGLVGESEGLCDYFHLAKSKRRERSRALPPSLEVHRLAGSSRERVAGEAEGKRTTEEESSKEVRAVSRGPPQDRTPKFDFSPTRNLVGSEHDEKPEARMTRHVVHSASSIYYLPCSLSSSVARYTLLDL